MLELLDYKDNYILDLLLTSSNNLTISDITKLLGISQRSTYYSISRINDYLESIDLPKLNSVRQKGIVVDDLVKEKLLKSDESKVKRTYILTQKERVVINILLLLIRKEYMTISYFEEIHQISRNTVVNDFREVRHLLNKYNLALEFDSNLGYIVAGTEIRKRSVILILISSYEYLLKIDSHNLYKDETVKEVKKRIKLLESKLNVSYVRDTMEYVSMGIAVIKDNDMEPIVLGNDDINQLHEYLEYDIVSEVFKGFLPDTEFYYITLHVLGLRIQYDDTLIQEEDDYIKELVHFIIDEFSRLTLIYFDDRETLFKNILMHIKPSMFRLKYGIVFNNELKEDMFQKYPHLTQIVRRICDGLEKKIGYPIGDDDVAYIAMHFGGFLKREKKKINQTKVLLVCLNGIATSKLLRKELEFLVGNVDIIDAVNIDQVDNYINDVDYIITTVPIKNIGLDERILKVNPILTELDKQNIINLIGIKSMTKNISDKIDMIMNDIKPYISEVNADKIKKKILNVLTKEKGNYTLDERTEKPMLNDLITREKIQFVNKVETWQEAIELSARPLIDDNSIEHKYVEKVIQNVNELGPYIVIAPKIAISHARPEDGVNQLGMTLMILDEAVNFSEDSDRLVNIVITLAAPDNEKHLLALQQLSTMLLEELEYLLTLRDKEAVIKVLDKYSN